jgi:hypothetical protein
MNLLVVDDMLIIEVDILGVQQVLDRVVEGIWGLIDTGNRHEDDGKKITERKRIKGRQECLDSSDETTVLHNQPPCILNRHLV